jgi:DNA primase
MKDLLEVIFEYYNEHHKTPGIDFFRAIKMIRTPTGPRQARLYTAPLGDKRVPAIKLFKDVMDSGLKEAKEAVVDSAEFTATPEQVLRLKKGLLELGLPFVID